MPLNLDTNTDFGARVARRLQEEQIIWLTTVGKDGTPQPNPVWFHWDGDTFMIFSEPNQAKVRHIEARPRVSLSFNTDQHGGDVVVFTGAARVAEAAPSEARLAEYVAKYAEGMKSLGLTREQMAATYSTTLYMTPDKVRGF
jgi:PPOX class probable F420-dependent enzyme